MKLGLKVIAMTGVMLCSGIPSASAIVTYDDANAYTWDWFVGKGDVQSAFGWTAKQSDANFDKVTFTFRDYVETLYGCVDTASGRYYEIIGSRTDTQTTTRQTAVEIRKGKTTVTGAFVTKSGTPTIVEVGGQCDEGYVRNSLRDTSRWETLTATIVETIKGKTNVTTAVLWTR